MAKVSGQFKEVTNLAFSSFKKQKFESISLRFGLFCVSLFVVVFVANVCCNSFELFFVLCCKNFGFSVCYMCNLKLVLSVIVVF